MIRSNNKYILVAVILLFFPIGFLVQAQIINLDASKLVPRVEIYLSPRSGSFVEGATFDVPIILNTKKININGIEVRINFDKDKLSIIKPSGGKSIIGIWIEPPKYDNARGTASYVGVVPDGITTDSGLIGTITFKALRPGSAAVSIGSNSSILLNDGLGTKAVIDLGRAEYDLLPKPPEGVNIFSETHPFQSNWYNNNNPVVSWEKNSGVDGFSYLLDDKPTTIPDNIINTKETLQSFENLGDGLWYFHIKASKKGAWGTAGHFLMRIDTVPPAVFKPEVDYLLAATILAERALISFSTTDNLSGVDFHEEGVIDKRQPTTVSPVFVRTESPFQVPLDSGSELRVIVRATDKAGNIRDVSMDVASPFIVTKFIKEYPFYILAFIIFIGLISLLIRYIISHHIIGNIRRFREQIKRESQVQGENKPPMA